MMATTAKGEKVDLWFRATLGFRKIAGQWKIVHEHSSVPFYMDGSFKAAVDLKPYLFQTYKGCLIYLDDGLNV